MNCLNNLSKNIFTNILNYIKIATLGTRRIKNLLRTLFSELLETLWQYVSSKKMGGKQ
jgi:hypothetical protein